MKIFYTNLQFNGDSLVSHVKGVDMVIKNDVLGCCNRVEEFWTENQQRKPWNC